MTLVLQMSSKQYNKRTVVISENIQRTIAFLLHNDYFPQIIEKSDPTQDRYSNMKRQVLRIQQAAF